MGHPVHCCMHGRLMLTEFLHAVVCSGNGEVSLFACAFYCKANVGNVLRWTQFVFVKLLCQLILQSRKGHKLKATPLRSREEMCRNHKSRKKQKKKIHTRIVYEHAIFCVLPASTGRSKSLSFDYI